MRTGGKERGETEREGERESCRLIWYLVQRRLDLILDSIHGSNQDHLKPAWSLACPPISPPEPKILPLRVLVFSLHLRLVLKTAVVAVKILVILV